VPWKETCIVDQRLEFIAAVRQEPRGNFTQLCARFGISRQTGYELVARYKQRGLAALEDRPPIAHECPHKTSGEVEDLVVEMRKKRPSEGPKKIKERLVKLHPGLELPAASTIGDILKRRGFIHPRRARLRVPLHASPLEPCSRPHEALGQKPPTSVYEPSWRPMREPRAPEYGDGFDVRRVRGNGTISIVGKQLYVGLLLAGQPLGLKQTDDDEWDVFYGPLLVGYLLVRKGEPRIEPVA
jgi:transposase